MDLQQLYRLHDELTRSAGALMVKKNRDYTANAGPFANFDTATMYGVHRVKGALVRLNDKLQRINSFIERGVLDVEDESVEDTIIDVINYAVLIAAMIRAEKEEECFARERDREEVLRFCKNERLVASQDDDRLDARFPRPYVTEHEWDRYFHRVQAQGPEAQTEPKEHYQPTAKTRV